METAQYTEFGHRNVGDVVAEDYRRGAVFKKFGIDFCCGGGRTVQDACDKKGVSYEELERALNAASAKRDGSGAPDVRTWNPDFLADYVVNVHHAYVQENMPILLQFSNKVARVHGHAQEELIGIAERVERLDAELRQHFAKEEHVLFPYIRDLVAATKEGKQPNNPLFGNVQSPIGVMMEEHDGAGELMAEIRALSADYTPAEWACNTYRALYAKLEEFEEDLHRHVHLENNILFPVSLELEKAAMAA